MPAIDPEDAPPADPVARARARLASPDHGGDVLVGRSPGFLDLLPPSTLLAIVVAIVAASLLDLRSAAAAQTLTAFDLLLRIVAAMAILRACVLVADGVGRLRAIGRGRGRAAVFLDDALVILGPTPIVLDRAEVVSAGAGERDSGLPVAFVVARRAEGSPVVRLPIPDDLDADAVARRVLRYRDECPAPNTPDAPDEATASARSTPTRDPAGTYDRVVAHEGPGETRIRAGLGWLRDLPIAGPAFGLVLVERAVALGSVEALLALGPAVLSVLGIAVAFPLGTIALGLARMRALGGAAMVATPAELLVRTRAGMHRVAWDDIVAITIARRRVFSTLGGPSVRGALIVERTTGASIRFEGNLLREPVSVVAEILEAYRDGAGSSPSQGTGGGGGISATDGTTT